ncbi:hypothetical protein DM860_003976 [Cuscuta australis]|uniref:Glutaredoxin domain-containing protein n=1 Tax=Cuscuta australis TaxID=267555 RepID=A0A328CVD6_9ASTE|nr:hypothetical protein DM860_003976 [Cuscuta australis]
MYSVKGKLLKKLKTVKKIGYLKPEIIILQEKETKKNLEPTVEDDPVMDDISLKMADLGNVFGDKENPRQKSSSLKPKIEPIGGKSLPEMDAPAFRRLDMNTGSLFDSGLVHVSEENPNLGSSFGDKENLRPKSSSSWSKIEPLGGNPLPEIDVSSFRRPDMNSGSLFDPNLLAAFEQVLISVRAMEAERMAMIDETIDQILKEEETQEALSKFEERCPPGGSQVVILYTTGLRGIRKTFEDCQRIRFLLENFKVSFFERDISMHREYREELWRALEGKVVPPRLFIKGRYIGGAEEVVGLHEQGKFKPLLHGIPLDESQGHCDSCGGIRFVLCSKCNGSTKILEEGGGGGGDGGGDWRRVRCGECNENGLVVCSLCSLR